jgi:hypothetical protein
MSVAKCKQEVSNREFRSWQIKFIEEWNTPSRSDHYLMQIAQKMDAYVVKLKPGKNIDLLKYVLPFSFKRKKEETTEEKGKRSKSIWHGFLGLKQDEK